MATTSITLPTQGWTQITTGEAAGTIYCGDLGAIVLFTEAETEPTTAPNETPLANTLSGAGTISYFGLSATTFIYARPVNNSTTITNSPKTT